MMLRSMIAAAFLGLAAPAALGQALPDGDYTCNARNSGGFALPLGTMSLAGPSYRFSPPNGLPPVTTGSYTVEPDGTMRWSGDLGAIRNAQIVKAQRAVRPPRSFWFDFKLEPNSVPMGVSCSQ